MRERLIELIEDAYFCNIEELADHLIDNGVIVLPCKVGDTLFINGIYHKAMEYVVEYIEILDNNEIKIVCNAVHHSICKAVGIEDFGKTVFLTKEEAEKALKGGAE